MKKLVLFFLIIGRISFGQNCGFIRSYEVLIYMPGFEESMKTVEQTVVYFQDSLENLYEDLFPPFVCVLSENKDTTGRAMKNLKFEQELEKIYQIEEELVDSIIRLSNRIVQDYFLMMREELNFFASIRKVSNISDIYLVYFCENPIDYTDEFIQYLLCRYEYD